MAAVASYFDLSREMKNSYNRNRYCGLIGSKVIRHLLVTQSDVETAKFDKGTCDLCGQSGKSCGHCRQSPLVMRLRKTRMLW